MLNLLSWNDDWGRLSMMNDREDPAGRWRSGVRDASLGWRDVGRQQEAERILAMNPDIVLTNEPVDDFLRDPRWQGLSAVRSRRVYNGPLRDFDGSSGNLFGLTFNPLWSRWLAEIAHPDRMPANLRERLRTQVETLYGYRLSKAEIDELLNVEKNHAADGYARFTAAYRPGTGR